MTVSNKPASGQTTARVLLASLIGTTVEFYDFYIYATAASLVFGRCSSGRAAIGRADQRLCELRPRLRGPADCGAVFGHFGDRVGRKATLVASLLLMGLSTSAIGLLPTSRSPVARARPALPPALRAGAWRSAASGAGPPSWRSRTPRRAGWARYAMFAPLGAPLGFFVANGLFLILTLA